MRVRRLGWAGIEIEAGSATVVVDLADTEPRRALLPESEMAPAAEGAVAALVTHMHSDHADAAVIRRVLAPEGVVLRPGPCESQWTEQAEAGFAAGDLAVRIVGEWESCRIGPFEITAVPAVDGLGDPQVNWVIAAGGRRVFHGGDTMFHGYWWRIAARLGPFDAAFLPVNGAAVDFPHLVPASPLPAVLTPEQAVVAGRILRARKLVPIHYGINRPPYYREVDDPLTAFRRAAEDAGIETLTPAPGEAVSFS